MPTYDDELFNPPAPVARVTLRHPESGATLADIQMLIDYGADATLLPVPSVDLLSIEAIAGTSYELSGFDDSTSVSKAVRADLILLRKTFKGHFLLINQDWGILGRDVLNHLSLWFDGPHLNWEERPLP
jgi:hypothetical protein